MQRLKGIWETASGTLKCTGALVGLVAAFGMAVASCAVPGGKTGRKIREALGRPLERTLGLDP